MNRIHNFDEWIDYFRAWQSQIGLDDPALKRYTFEAKFGPPEVRTIEFGHFKGQPKWNSLLEIPDQRIRDALLNLIVVQGDTEFASVEQQRSLFATAPTEPDLAALQRIMAEEMRHGWQMCHLLCTYFGEEGRLEAGKQLERRAWARNRLLGSFNELVSCWLDFFTYTEFIDRDGKFQLKMLSTSAFEPLARSMAPMLKEESFHLGTGHSGLARIIKAGVVHVDLIQRFINKWVPTAYDLFGTDHSSSAHWSYVWGLKGRYDERDNTRDADQGRLNETSRAMYYEEVHKLVDQLNKGIPADKPRLLVPALEFNRKIGDHAGRCFDVTGNPVDSNAYRAYLAGALPSDADHATLAALTSKPGWIEPRKPDQAGA